MHIKTIKLGKTYNDGNYESTRIDIEVDVLPGEDADEVFSLMADRIDHLRKVQRRRER